MACNFVDGNPEPKNWQKYSRQKSLRFILRFGPEYSSGTNPGWPLKLIISSAFDAFILDADDDDGDDGDDDDSRICLQYNYIHTQIHLKSHGHC